MKPEYDPAHFEPTAPPRETPLVNMQGWDSSPWNLRFPAGWVTLLPIRPSDVVDKGDGCYEVAYRFEVKPPPERS